MHNIPATRLCLTFLLSLLLLGSQILAGPLEVSSVRDPAPNKRIQKRGILQDLYATVPDKDKVNTGNAIPFELLPNKGKDAAVYAPTEFYGCTLVVVVNGNGIIIGHFAQEKPGNIKCMEDNTSIQSMINKLEDAESEIDVDDVYGTRAWIIYSDDVSQTSAGYQAIYKNLNGEDRLNIPKDSIKDITYRRGGGGGNSDKLVVQWQPANDGGGTLHVYIRSDAAAFVGTYDKTGKLRQGAAPPS